MTHATFSIDLDVYDPQLLWDTATQRALDDGYPPDDDVLGTRNEPDVRGCLTMLLDPGSLPGCSINDSDVEVHHEFD
jgi:hypothetical protein